jgi:hypothetical protein
LCWENARERKSLSWFVVRLFNQGALLEGAMHAFPLSEVPISRSSQGTLEEVVNTHKPSFFFLPSETVRGSVMLLF